MRTDKCGWCAVIKTKPRGCVDVTGIDEETPYQDEMAHVEQITEIEEMIGLHDETHSDEEVDATLVQTMEFEKRVDEDCNEDGHEDYREDSDIMHPKENRKVNIPSKKKRMTTSHRVNHAAKHAHTSAVESPIDDNASTPGQLNARQDDVEQSNTGFVLQNTVASSSSPTIDPSSSAQPSTSISSRHTLQSHDPTLSLLAYSGDDRVQGSQPSHLEDEKAPDGRPYIFPDGRGWNPCRVASKALTFVIRSQFRRAWSSWGKIPGKRVDRMFMKFGTQVAWRTEDEFELKNIFKGKGSKRLSEMLTEVRNKRKRPSWIGENAWKGLQKTWNSAAYKLKSARAKQNRDSAKGGSVHTGGSISTKEHVIRMRRELGREPTLDEDFLRTHTKKKDSSWVDERAKKTYESFQEKVKHVCQVGQTSGSGTKEVDAATRFKLWAESAGGKKRGLLYGVGDMSKHYKPGVSSLTQAYSTQVATNSSIEITAQIEAVVQRANAAEEDARVAREECQRANQRIKNLERQMKKLAQKVSCIKGDQHRRHRDYEEDDSDSMDESIDNLAR
ncbi:hypothetical protein TSUD_415640 [Trifolium subterraneum]|uniref:Transposase, Ptta/En/Spm, plant n=1 Tax=Trifolium subterraneum TaxID=3900 RepID=A0A2Z6P5X2_TRISU|nr:hypothetical protein TSUD_415640 [Trifolium subterraneum]